MKANAHNITLTGIKQGTRSHVSADCISETADTHMKKTIPGKTYGKLTSGSELQW